MLLAEQGTSGISMLLTPLHTADVDRLPGAAQGENTMNDLMIKLFVKMQTLMIREEGQDLVEYALVVALVAFGATAALKTLGTGLNTAFSNISSTLASSLS
jgi:pilus assembly protein Flp/PilA